MSRSGDYQDGYFAELARQVGKGFARDEARKRRILQGAPRLAFAFDSEDIAKMSASELAKADLKQYGLKVSDNSDPIEVRDAFHAGRQHERQRAAGGSAQDSSDDSFVSRYLK